MKVFTIVWLALALCMSGCGEDAPKPGVEKAPVAADKAPAAADKAPAAADKAPGAASNLTILMAGYTAYNKGDLDGALAGFADDVEWTAVGQPTMKGKGAVRKFLEAFKKGFPDNAITPVRIFDGGDMVVVEGVFSGTHKGEFMGIPPTGKPIGIHALHIWHYKDGKVVKALTVSDGMSVMKQVGAGPEDSMSNGEPVAKPEGEPVIVSGPPTAEAMAGYKQMGQDMMSEDPAKMAKYVADGIVHRDMAMNKTFETAAEHGEMMKMWMTAFPEAKAAVVSARMIGNYGITHMTWTGKHAGPLGKIPATHKDIHTNALDIAEFAADGSFQGSTSYSNHIEIGMQLGLMKPPE